LFKKETGVTINDYITEIRLAEAKRLLREEPGILVFDVAERVGYRDGKYFTKLFKREVGLNPSEYRERV
jgi:two-component system response regulator YesN